MKPKPPLMGLCPIFQNVCWPQYLSYGSQGTSVLIEESNDNEYFLARYTAKNFLDKGKGQR